MKKLLFAAFVLASVSCITLTNADGKNYFVGSGDGIHIPASQVPAAVLASFNQLFPTATNVRWELEREHGADVYKADFTVNGSRSRVKFAANGTVIGNNGNSGPGNGGGGNGGGGNDGPGHH